MSELALDLSNPDSYNPTPPHQLFKRLRRDDPISWQSEAQGRGFWAVTRYHDVVSVLRDPGLFSSWLGGVLIMDQPPEFLPRFRESMLNRDPPDHTALRRIVNKAFSPKRIGELEARIADRARMLIDRVVAAGECDFVTDIAREMTLFVICEILGVPDEDRNRLFSLTGRMLGTEIVDPVAGLQDGIAAAREMRAYAADLGRQKKSHPADDLVSDLLHAEIDSHALSDGDFQAFFMLLFNAGSETTISLLCHGLDLLLDRPDDLAALQSDRGLLTVSIEEMLRYESPVISFRRTATRATELGGRQIAEGDKVVVFFCSANRDETVFADSDRFDIRRWPNPHLAFGFGTHFCLGAPLARLESKHVFAQVIDRLNHIERAGPLVPTRSNFIRGVRQLRIRF
jgi:cytochrome P450